MAEAPASRILRKVGSAARMRRSFVMLPVASSGTLKSTRTSTFLPRKSRKSSSVFLAMSHPKTPLALANHVAQQIDAAVGVAPFVVVPANELEEAIIQLDSRAGVEDAGVLVVDEVAGHDLIARVSEYVLQVRLARFFHGGADFLVAGRLDGA